MDHSEPAAGTIALAVQIADKTVRCDIELFCRDTWIDGVRHFDANAPRLFGEDLGTVRDALEYIRLRGDVFPWALKRHHIHTQLICFEETT
ncbi:MAG: hypothetical protein ACRES5_27225 [Pseudomonas sp.]|uniref:hypothetical protein n=1 Tax=Stenotrophomonas sp. TaxID=69392 RepID=UPI003D6D57DF